MSVSLIRRLRTKHALFIDLLVLLLVGLPAVLPLLSQGYVRGSDQADPPWRAFLLQQALRDGVLFPRWTADAFYRYGYPVFNFYSPLSFYAVMVVGMVMPIGFVAATKVVFGACVLAAGIGGYLLAREMTDRRDVALLAGVLYLYSPMNLGEVYVRSNGPGSGALALLPFVLWLFVRICRAPSLAGAGVGGALLGAMILTHNLTSMIGAGMAVVMLGIHFLMKRDRSVLAMGALAVALGLGLSSMLWLAVVLETPWTHTEMLFGGIPDFRYHLLNPLGDIDQTLFWRYGYEPYRQTQFGLFDLHLAYPYGSPPYKLSLFQALLLAAGVVAVVTRKSRPAHIPALLLLAVAFLFLNTTWSWWIWETFISFVQFPWRMTGHLGLCLAVLGAWAAYSLGKRHSTAVLLAVGVAGIFSGLATLPTTLAPFEGGSEITRDGFLLFEHREGNRVATQPDGQFLPASVQWDRDTMSLRDMGTLYDRVYPPENWVGETAMVREGDRGLVLAARRNQSRMEAAVYAEAPSTVLFHSIAYQGWSAYLDGKKVDIHPTGWESYPDGPRGIPARASLGVVQLQVPEGRHDLKLIFEDTALRRVGGAIAALSVLGIAAAILVDLRRRWTTPGSKNVTWVAGVAVIAAACLGCLSCYGSLPSLDPAWVENDVARDLTNMGKQGKLRLQTPPGSNPTDFIHAKSFTIDGDTRPVLFMHPTSSASIRSWIPEGAQLKLSMALDPAVWDKPGDGVRFEVEVRDGEKVDRLLSSFVNPKQDASQRRWVDASIDLSSYAHKEVELVLRTSPGSSAEYAWAGWATPRIVVKPELLH